MGLLNGGAYAPGGGMPMRPQMPQPQMQPPQMPQQGGGFLGAFSGNPQFQQQLMQLLNNQGPGFQPVPMTPPATPMQTGPATGADLWHDGIDGNARAAGLTKPGGRHGFNLGASLLGGGIFGGM